MEQTISPNEQSFYPDDTPSFGDRPLIRLLDDDNIRMMEHFIPYCRDPVNRFLALNIKLIEIQKILRGFDRPQLKACGLDEENRDVESVLRSLKKNVSPETGAQIDSILQIFQFRRIYQRFNQITREHPEILRMMTAGGSNPSSNGADVFSDPSVFILLNSMLNNNDGDSKDIMKNVLDLAMNGGGENMDMGSLLASLMNRQG